MDRIALCGDGYAFIINKHERPACFAHERDKLVSDRANSDIRVNEFLAQIYRGVGPIGTFTVQAPAGKN